jgi:prepilin-type N-terminal cleavage/methylation domain-containing protein
MKNRGYSLIELLVAVGVFALAVPGVLALLSSAGEAHRMSIHRTKMALLAQTVLDESRLQARQGREVKEVAGVEHPLFPGYYYDINLWPLDPYEREYLVEMFIRWYKTGREPAARQTPGTESNGEAYYTIICVK